MDGGIHRMELWTMVLTGGVGAAAIKLLDHVIQWGLKRWEGRRAGAARVETEQEKKINGLQAGLRVVLVGPHPIPGPVLSGRRGNFL